MEPPRRIANPGDERVERAWSRATWAVVAVHVALIAATFRDYGITYDETWRARYGEYVLRWYATLFEDRRALTYWTLHFEGGFWGAIQQLVALGSPLGRYETGHLMNALMGALGVLGAARVGRRLGGPAVGFLAALLLVSMPRWYGEFANPADVPMATLSIWSLAFLLDVLDCLPQPSLAALGKLGVTIGCAIAVRTGALILLAYVAWALTLWFAGRRASRDGSPGGDLLRCVRAFGVATASAWLAMVAFWPAAQVHPRHPARGLLEALRYKGNIPVLFEGETISNQELPWWYVLRWFSLVTPEHVLALALAAAALGLAAFFRSPRRAVRVEGGLKTFAVASAVVAPLTYASLGGAIDYDGIRHFLFVLPPLAVVCALAAVRVARAAPPLARWTGAAVLAASIAWVASDMVRLHPYQYVYFNRALAGGLRGADGRFDLEYWGACQRESALWLAANRAGPIESDGGRRPRVASTGYSTSTAYYLPTDSFEFIGSVDDGTDEAARWHPSQNDPWPDYFLAQPRWDGYRHFPGKTVHSVERMGVELARVVAVDSRPR